MAYNTFDLMSEFVHGNQIGNFFHRIDFDSENIQPKYLT